MDDFETEHPCGHYAVPGSKDGLLHRVVHVPEWDGGFVTLPSRWEVWSYLGDSLQEVIMITHRGGVVTHPSNVKLARLLA